MGDGGQCLQNWPYRLAVLVLLAIRIRLRPLSAHSSKVLDGGSAMRGLSSRCLLASRKCACPGPPNRGSSEPRTATFFAATVLPGTGTPVGVRRACRPSQFFYGGRDDSA